MFLIFVTGCKTKENFTPVKTLDCIITYTANGTEYSANLKSFGGGIVEIEMLSPALVKGLKYTHDNAGGSISYLGLEVPTNSIDSGILEEIADICLDIYSSSIPVEKTKDGYKSDLNGIKIRFDALGYLTSLNINNNTINFSEHKKTD